MKTVAAFDHTYSLDPTDFFHPTLHIDATKIVNTASSAGIGVDSISTQATSDIGSANFLLTDNPPDILSILGLSVSARLVHSDANASYVFGPNRGSLSGDASFGSLRIAGALIGGETLTFSGDAGANTIPYKSTSKSPSVTITLDKQILSEFLPPSASSPTGPNQITTDALDIHLNNAHLFGRTISGDITLGVTSAALFPPLHA
jgi:hypothetical protein